MKVGPGGRAVDDARDTVGRILVEFRPAAAAVRKRAAFTMHGRPLARCQSSKPDRVERRPIRNIAESEGGSAIARALIDVDRVAEQLNEFLQMELARGHLLHALLLYDLWSCSNCGDRPRRAIPWTKSGFAQLSVPLGLIVPACKDALPFLRPGQKGAASEVQHHEDGPHPI